MRRYRFHGKDSSSDNGYWEVIIIDKDLRAARQRVKEHLQAMNRSDLLDGCILAESSKHTAGLVHSTVESR